MFGYFASLFYHSDSHPSMLASSSLSCKSIQIDPKWWQLETTNPSLRPSHGHQLIMRWTLAYAHWIVVGNTQFGQYCLHLVFGVWPATYIITFGLCVKLWLSGPNQHSFISCDWQDTCSCTSTRRREWESQGWGDPNSFFELLLLGNKFVSRLWLSSSFLRKMNKP